MLVRTFLHLSFLISITGWAQTPSDSISDRLLAVRESTYTAYVKGLEAFGTRHAEQSNRAMVAAWISDRFRDAGLDDVQLDSFSVGGSPQWNVVATLRGSDTTLGEIILGAHYDSQSSIVAQAPGADDNASGTAAILEIARALRVSGYQPRRSLRFVAFAAEELGLLGSEWYASRIPVERRPSLLMLNFDMIGTRNRNTMDRDVFVVYYYHAIERANEAVSLTAKYTSLTPFLTTTYQSQSDSWSFANVGVPCVFYIERDFSPYYHSPRDSAFYLDMAYATEVAKAGMAMVLSNDAVTTIASHERELPEGWALLQNYPNPFNPSTRIAWMMRERGWVDVSVWNALGQRMTVLVEGEREAGYHEAEVSDRQSVASWPSGVYYYRIVIRSQREYFTSTKAMVLAK